MKARPRKECRGRVQRACRPVALRLGSTIMPRHWLIFSRSNMVSHEDKHSDPGSVPWTADSYSAADREEILQHAFAELNQSPPSSGGKTMAPCFKKLMGK